QVGVRAKPERYAFGDLCHFERMGEPGTKEIALVDTKHLRLSLQPAKGRRVDDTRPVALELGAVVGLRTLGLGSLATGILNTSRCDHAGLLALSPDSSGGATVHFPNRDNP